VFDDFGLQKLDDEFLKSKGLPLDYVDSAINGR
jgi:hypothetical protein